MEPRQPTFLNRTHEVRLFPGLVLDARTEATVRQTGCLAARGARMFRAKAARIGACIDSGKASSAKAILTAVLTADSRYRLALSETIRHENTNN